MSEQNQSHSHDIEWKGEKICSTENSPNALYYEGECSKCHRRFREVYILSGYYEVKQPGQENEEEIYLGDAIPFEDCK